MRAATIATALILGTTACTGGQPEPEHPTVPTVRVEELGQMYDIVTERGDSLGHVKVFTQGADLYDHGIWDRAAVHVGYWVSNECSEPIRVAPGKVTVVSSFPQGDGALTLHAEADDEGDLVLLPGQRRRIDTYSYVPVHVLPKDIRAIHVRWAVRSEKDGATYHQRTPFVAVQRPGQGQLFAPAVDTLFYGAAEFPESVTAKIP